MFIALLFAVSIAVYGVAGKSPLKVAQCFLCLIYLYSMSNMTLDFYDQTMMHLQYFAGTQSVQFKMEDGLKLSYDYSTTNLISPTDPIGTSQLNAVWCLSPGANIPCHFGTYDLNSGVEISLKEFLSATRGFTKMDPTTLFERLDTNGDETISIDEFTHVDPSLGDAGIIPRCRRGWCVSIKIGCITITISSDRQTPTQAESEKISSEN